MLQQSKRKANEVGSKNLVILIIEEISSKREYNLLLVFPYFPYASLDIYKAIQVVPLKCKYLAPTTWLQLNPQTVHYLIMRQRFGDKHNFKFTQK